MKALLILLFLVTVAPLRGDIPPSFDPRKKIPKGELIKGGAFVIQPSPLSADYLILTRPLDDNPGGEFTIYHARLKKGINRNKIPSGQYAMVEARRVPRKENSKVAFEIVSITAIMFW